MDFGPFLTLLGAIWVAFVPFSATVKTLNEIRDKVLSLAPDYSPDHRSLMLSNDWVPILISAGFQQLALAVLLFLLPSFAPLKPDVKDPIRWFCYVLAAFAVLRLIGFVFYHRRDYVAMARHLGSLSSHNTSAKTVEVSGRM